MSTPIRQSFRYMIRALRKFHMKKGAVKKSDRKYQLKKYNLYKDESLSESASRFERNKLKTGLSKADKALDEKYRLNKAAQKLKSMNMYWN